MNTILSDYNKPAYKAEVVSGKYYQDISDQLIHPISGALIPATDIDAVRNSIRNIILTPIGTRPFNPSFGTNLQLLLFEHPGPSTAIGIKSEIESALERLDKRIKITDISVFEREFDTNYEVKITFILGYSEPQEISITLNRLR